MQEQQPKKGLPKRWRVVIIAMGTLWLLLAGAGVTYFVRSHMSSQKRDPVDQAKYITARVGKIYLLPTNEKPTVAEIKDMSKLADQQFYSQARNGDFLVLYPETKLAIIYRDSTNMLINVAPISIPNRNQ